MLLAALRWLGRNLGTLLLAFLLSVVVWVSAVVTNDPNEERVFTRQVNLLGKADEIMIVEENPTQVRVRVNAPRSILNQISNNPSLLEARVDISSYKEGDYSLPVAVAWKVDPVRLIQVEPDEIDLVLEPIISRQFPVQLSVNGEPALGYNKGEPSISPTQAVVNGRETLVNQVAQIRAILDITGANEMIETTVPLIAEDVNGNIVSNITISPKVVTVTQPVTLLGGFKNVVVKVVTQGNIAEGYRLTNIQPTPPTVTVFSEDPTLVNQLPGYVETLPVDLSGLTDDSEVRVSLNLPKGVSLVGVQSVLVQIGIATIEGSLTISLPVEVIGLPPSLAEEVSPVTVDVLVSGPLPVLDNLTRDSFRVVVDVTGYTEGVYQLVPVVDLAPDAVVIESINPETIQVRIFIAPTATASPSPAPPGSLTSTPQP